jgi:quercetin dioxygenase-like cupin family protein
MAAVEEIQIVDLDQGPELAILEGAGRAHAVIWPGMGARLRSIHRIDLGAGARTVELRHPSEAVYYVMDGSGEAVEVGADDKQQLRRGSMVHVEADTTYRLSAGERGMSIVGGPSPPDPALYEVVA